MTEDIPEPWLTLLRERGLDSYRKLAAEAGLAHETVRKVIRGWKSSPQSIEKVAGALGLDAATVHTWRGEAVPDRAREYVPPPESKYLTRAEREAVNTLIRLLVAHEESDSADVVALNGRRRVTSPADYAGLQPEDLTGAAAAYQPHESIADLEAEQEGYEEYP